jgi:hypothetical protein
MYLDKQGASKFLEILKIFAKKKLRPKTLLISRIFLKKHETKPKVLNKIKEVPNTTGTYLPTYLPNYSLFWGTRDTQLLPRLLPKVQVQHFICSKIILF